MEAERLSREKRRLQAEEEGFSGLTGRQWFLNVRCACVHVCTAVFMCV